MKLANAIAKYPKPAIESLGSTILTMPSSNVARRLRLVSLFIQRCPDAMGGAHQAARHMHLAKK